VSFQIGDIVGNYRVTGLLGSGGAGHVYRVEHTITGQTEAMKVLLESGGAGQAAQAERFLREIQVQARLQHPNVAAVHNAFWADGRLVMVMEFVEGEPLDQRLARGPIPLGEGVGYMQQVLSALSYAHARDVIHRDIKPANLIIAHRDDTIKVMDFGLARAASDPKLTQTGAVAGSLYYIAPEQVRALANIDARADIYSLGAVFYEVVTGRKPFVCDQAFELMSAHVHQPPDPPIELTPSLPPALNSAILRAMAKDPAERFQSADEFLEATRHAFAEQENAGSEPSASTERRKPKQQGASAVRGGRPRIAAAALVAIVLAVASVLIMSRQRTQSVSEATSTGEFELLRGLHVREGLTVAAFSPDNRWIAAGAGDRRVKIWNARTAQEYASLAGHEGAITALAFSPDGNILASGGTDKTVRLWDLSTQQAKATLRHSAEVVSVAFTRDGRRLAAGTSDRSIRLWDASTGESFFKLSARLDPLILAFAPDTERLAAAGAQTQVQLWDLAHSTTASRLLDVGSGIVAMRFLTGGSLATISSSGLREWDAASLREKRGLDAPGAVAAFASSARGDRMILMVRDSTVTVHELAAAQDIALLQHGRPVTNAIFNSDGLKAATYTSTGDFWLWQATPSLEAQALTVPIAEDPIAEEAKPTPFAKAEDKAAVENNREQRAGKVERDRRRRPGVFRRLLGIFR